MQMKDIEKCLEEFKEFIREHEEVELYASEILEIWARSKTENETIPVMAPICNAYAVGFMTAWKMVKEGKLKT